MNKTSRSGSAPQWCYLRRESLPHQTKGRVLNNKDILWLIGNRPESSVVVEIDMPMPGGDSAWVGVGVSSSSTAIK